MWLARLWLPRPTEAAWSLRQSNPPCSPGHTRYWIGDLTSNIAPTLGQLKWSLSNPLVCPYLEWEGHTGAYHWQVCMHKKCILCKGVDTGGGGGFGGWSPPDFQLYIIFVGNNCWLVSNISLNLQNRSFILPNLWKFLLKSAFLWHFQYQCRKFLHACAQWSSSPSPHIINCIYTHAVGWHLDRARQTIEFNTVYGLGAHHLLPPRDVTPGPPMIIGASLSPTLGSGVSD